MRAKIKAIGTSVSPGVMSSIEHGVIAGKNCIEKAGIKLDEVSYIFNVGVYRDSNMVEPSMAALIQKGIGINRDFIRFPVSATTFSADLMNGASGALNALQVTDALFRAGRKGYVLVISCDAHPSSGPAEGFPVNPCGAAILLESSETDTGFSGFVFNDTTDEYIGESSYVDFEKRGLEGRTTIEVVAEPDYHEKLLYFSALTASGFIKEQGIDPKTTALIAPSFNASFASDLGKRLNFTDDAVINTWSKYGNPFTSFFGLGFDLLESNTELDNYRKVLVVGAGAGLNANCALYHR